jgi:ATP-dependent Clp protease ATP-binding subunit ClpA
MKIYSEPIADSTSRTATTSNSTPSTQAHDDRLPGLRRLQEHLLQGIRGQSDVVPRIVSVLQRGELGLSHQERPRGSFMFLGPTGVGKTEITLQFSDYLFGEGHLARFDMSEFQAEDSVRLLIGAHNNDGGRLGAVLQKMERGTLLFDEMEKAEKKILDIFLQMTDAARITLATGQTYRLSNFYLVFTSNIGSADIMRMEKAPYTSLERHVLAKASQQLRPEFFARITEKLVFRKLSYQVQIEVAEIMLQKELRQLAAKGYPLDPDEKVMNFLVMKGYHPYLGARPMRTAIEKYVQDAVVESILQGGSGSGRIMVDLTRDRLRVEELSSPSRSINVAQEIC